MPSLTLSITSAGPVIEVHVGVSAPRRAALLAASREVPPPVMATFLIDSGASMSLVDTSLIAPLGLNPTGVAMGHTPSTKGVAQRFDQFDLQLYLRGSGPGEGWVVDPVPVMATSFVNQSVQGLIGRDILDRSLFIYNGKVRQYTLAY